jgi:hypothetical protein
VQRYLAPSDFSVAETWRLVEWCRRLGADEFTIDCVGTSSLTDEKIRRPFETMVQPFVRPERTRERMSGRTADDLTRSTKLWELNDVTVQALKRALPSGVLAYDPAEQGWFEDPVFYREGNLLLGILSHEAFAVLRLSDVEAEQLSKAKFPSHDSLPRIA